MAEVALAFQTGCYSIPTLCLSFGIIMAINMLYKLCLEDKNEALCCEYL